MTTKAMTPNELLLLIALERMIQWAYMEEWDVKDGPDLAQKDAKEAVRIARLET